MVAAGPSQPLLQPWRSWHGLIAGQGQSWGSKSERTFSVHNSGERPFHCRLPKWYASDVASLQMSVCGTLPRCGWTCPPHQTSQLFRSSLCFIATESCPDHISLAVFLACPPRKCVWNHWVVTCGLWIRLFAFVSWFTTYCSISRSSIFPIYKMALILMRSLMRIKWENLEPCLTLINHWGTE